MTFLKASCAVVALMLSTVAFGQTYSVGVSNSSSKTITAAEHGMTCDSSKGVGIRIENSGTFLTRDNYTAVWQGANNCDLLVTFAYAYTGTIYLYGPYAATSSGDDFYAAFTDADDPYTAKISVLAGSGGYAYRVGVGVLERNIYWTSDGVSFGGATVRVYVYRGRVVVATSNGDTGSVDNPVDGDAVTATNVSSFPSGSIPLWSATLNYNGTWSNITDYR